MAKRKKQEQEVSVRPPIVTVVGHVDHGKTTLLDKIRNSDIASKEHGGITQHIGAYQISVPKKDSKTEQKITFIDTPGHEAFEKMRSRGAQVADIAVVVVAADDSVKPQTVESVEKVRNAHVPMIIAANKMDTPGANIQKVKQDLAKIGVQVEGFGGDVPLVTVSAKTGQGVNDLLDMILLMYDLNPVPAVTESQSESVVIETKIDKGKGIVATLIVKRGVLKYQTQLFDGERSIGKIRAMFDEYGKRVDQAEPGKPVEVIGFTEFPTIGTTLSSSPVPGSKPVGVPEKSDTGELPDFLKPVEEIQELRVVLKADTAGSLEAIKQALPKKINVVSEGIGTINEADILLAKSTKAFVIGFSVKAAQEVTKLAQTERVILRTYTIIYDLLNELSEVVEGISEVISKEREMGSGVIIAEFPFNNQRIAGTRVVTGRIARGDTVKILRDDKEIGRTKIKSIRQAKNELNKVVEGQECGILLDKKVDFLVNDVIIAVSQL